MHEKDRPETVLRSSSSNTLMKIRRTFNDIDMIKEIQRCNQTNLDAPRVRCGRPW